jgi:hypothetical protein
MKTHKRKERGKTNDRKVNGRIKGRTKKGQNTV